MSTITDFQTKFGVKRYKIYETNCWVWSLRPYQATIGAGILSLKRECATFSGLKSEEYCDLNNIIKVIEPTLKNVLNYDVINYLMLMMMDKHVHFHIFPRYKNPVEFIGKTWTDESWPAIPNLSGETLPDDKLQRISSLIKSNIKDTFIE